MNKLSTFSSVYLTLWCKVKKKMLLWKNVVIFSTYLFLIGKKFWAWNKEEKHNSSCGHKAEGLREAEEEAARQNWQQDQGESWGRDGNGTYAMNFVVNTFLVKSKFNVYKKIIILF